MKTALLPATDPFSLSFSHKKCTIIHELKKLSSDKSKGGGKFVFVHENECICSYTRFRLDTKRK